MVIIIPIIIKFCPLKAHFQNQNIMGMIPPLNSSVQTANLYNINPNSNIVMTNQQIN